MKQLTYDKNKEQVMMPHIIIIILLWFITFWGVSCRLRIRDAPERVTSPNYTLDFTENVIASDGSKFFPCSVFMVKLYDDGKYDLFYGDRHPDQPESCGGASMVRTGVMSEAQVNSLLSLPWIDTTSLFSKERVKHICIATNSVMTASRDVLDVLNFVVTNANSGGWIYTPEQFNPLVFHFVDPVNSVEFGNGLGGYIKRRVQK